MEVKLPNDDAPISIRVPMDDMKKLDSLYEELLWDHRDKLEFAIEGNHITIRNKSREGR